MALSRRQLFAATGGALVSAKALSHWSFAAENRPSATERTFHLSVLADALEADPKLLAAIGDAGVTNVWLTGFYAGHWLSSLERIRAWRKKAEMIGMAAHVINMPLGHPGTSLPKHWHVATSVDGKEYTGTSLHHPATKENSRALRQIEAVGVKRTFLDDDFRLARYPGQIGGCFCPEHKQAFLQHTGHPESRWQDLLEAVVHRDLTPVLCAWIKFNCDRLTECFRAQQKAVPNVQLGIMVMYLGAEKAGIRLTDYGDVPLRVGEFKFNDESFTPVKGKTDELFSSLFHRRFVRPELAYSETTAYPDKRLALKNKVAKLAVSTISDVRNTMFMCDFPTEHWSTLGPAMKRHAELHARIAGHALRGPLKHFWGEPSRYVGDDDPYSLFLALGIPFEVTGEPVADGFTFLSDADAGAVGTLRSPGAAFVARPGSVAPDGIRMVPESLPELYAFKREILPRLGEVPHVENEAPVVCAWYPTARAVILWNLAERHVELTFRHRNTRRTIGVPGLDVVLIEGVDG